MNYIPQIAKMLGVEIYEKFDALKGNFVHCSGCYFTNEAFIVEGATKELTGDVLMRILSGRWRVKKLPWKPKNDEGYYSPCVSEGIANYDYHYWNNEQIDLPRYNANLVCRTKEEALEKAKKMLAAVKDDE